MAREGELQEVVPEEDEEVMSQDSKRNSDNQSIEAQIHTIKHNGSGLAFNS